MRRLFFLVLNLLVLFKVTWFHQIALAQPIPPPPPGMSDDLEEGEDEEEEDDEDLEEAPMMRPPPMPNPMNSVNPNAGNSGPLPVPGGGRSDLGFNRASNSAALGTTGIRSGPAKFKFKVLDGEFWERGKKRGRSPKGTPEYSSGPSSSQD